MRTSRSILGISKVKMLKASALGYMSRRYIAASGPNEYYADIIIAGGGMVGTSLACALGVSNHLEGKSVCLLEASLEPQSKDRRVKPYENRVSPITPGSKDFFHGIGVWNEINNRRHHPFCKIHVWDGCSSGSISFKADDLNEEQIAYMIENSVIVESCTEVAKTLKDVVDIQYNTKISDILFPSHIGTENVDDLVTVQLHNGKKMKTKLLVGADGFNSFVRSKAKFETYDYDYGQSAVVATLKITEQDLDNQTAWQRFLPTGPIALLPIGSNYSSLVWSTSKSQAKELMKLSDTEFVTQVNEAVCTQPTANQLLDTVTGIMKAVTSTIQPGQYASNYLKSPPVVTQVNPGSRGMFPLGLKHSMYYVKSRMALIGDAAHRIHPMAGQGVNLGFGDVKKLVEVIEAAIDKGADVGTLDHLLEYESDRQKHVVTIMGAINALNGLFTTERMPLVFARSLGLQVTDAMPPIKDQIVKYAMS